MGRKNRRAPENAGARHRIDVKLPGAQTETVGRRTKTVPGWGNYMPPGYLSKVVDAAQAQDDKGGGAEDYYDPYS